MKKIFSNICIIILTIILIFSLYKIIIWIRENNKNNKIINEVSKAISIVQENNTTDNNTVNYDVNFEKLKLINPDCIAWLKVEGTSIEYPIVKGSDNSFYLKHSLDMSYNSAGWPFIDYRNSNELNDKNIIIYGHNRKDGSMFSTLNNILDEKWYEEDMDIVLVTENDTYKYQTFSVYQIPSEDYYLQTTFADNNEFQEFIFTLKERSIYEFNVDITENDSILTLSTCGINNKYRTVLHAKKIN